MDGGTVVTPAAVVAMGAYGNSVCLAVSFHGISWYSFDSMESKRKKRKTHN